MTDTSVTETAARATVRQAMARLLLTIDGYDLPGPTVVRLDVHGRVSLTVSGSADLESWRQALAPTATVHDTGSYRWFDKADWAPGWALTVDAREAQAVSA